MATLPERLSRVIWWVKVRLPAWAADPAFIGLDEQIVDELATLADEATQALLEYRRAKAAASAAGAAYRDRARLLRTKASSAIARVRGHAATRPDAAAVLAAARLKKRARPGRAPAPGTADRFRAQLVEPGWLACTFTCRHDRSLRGVTYLVERSLAMAGESDGPFEFLTLARGRAFTDQAIPRGTARATYRITAQTSTRAGRAALFTVRFGSVDGRATVRQGSDARAA